MAGGRIYPVAITLVAPITATEEETYSVIDFTFSSSSLAYFKMAFCNNMDSHTADRHQNASYMSLPWISHGVCVKGPRKMWERNRNATIPQYVILYYWKPRRRILLIVFP
ncbi:hypothetical protein V2G26_006244 [Clonostachys chloroleuca]